MDDIYTRVYNANQTMNQTMNLNQTTMNQTMIMPNITILLKHNNINKRWYICI